jgi:hypothetical protein
MPNNQLNRAVRISVEQSVDTPSISDEFYSVGDRACFPIDHADYSNQGLNALPECLGKRGGSKDLGSQQHSWLFDSVNDILVRELARGNEVLAREQDLLLAAADEIETEAPGRFAGLGERRREAKKQDGHQESKSPPERQGQNERKTQTPTSKNEVRS